MRRAQNPYELLPLTPPVFHLLVALSDGERHGYALMRQVAEDTDGTLQLGPGTLYGCLQRMLAAGLIAESDQRSDPQLDDERRRYYRITDFGTRVVTAEAKRLAAAVTVARARRLLPRGPRP
jgi:DNA-binding PadR family transcriptional regulator